MKNPIRKYIARIVREEVVKMRWEDNMKAIRAEESAWWRWTQLRQEGRYQEAEEVLRGVK